jgi:two-component system, LytTR family, sensor kinase
MVLRLSNLLRYVIYDGKAEQVEVKREVEQIREYIELFQMRNEMPVDISFHATGNLDGRRLEPMILIPIVENCLKHCDFDTNEKAFARIELKADGDGLSFRTVNTRNEREVQKDMVGGVGLENIQKRLELKYPGRYRFSVKNLPDLFEVELNIG